MVLYKSIFITMIVFCLLIVIKPVNASEPFMDMPQENVVSIMSDMRDHLPKAKISNTEFVGEETAEQRAIPLLSEEEGEVVLVRGLISVTAEWCGLDWDKKSFLPFMKEQRKIGRSEKHMAYIGLLHGYAMGIMTNSYKKASCSEAMKSRVKGYLY